MNRYTFILCFLLWSLSCSTEQPKEALDSIYLGQETPDRIPKIFGKGIVSVEGRFDLGFTLSSDGKSMAFGVAHESNPKETCIYLMRNANGKWTSPDRSFLPDNINTFFPMFSPSGDELYFVKSVGDASTDLWVAKYHDHRAIEPQPMDSIFNSSSREAGHGLSRNGLFYFTSNRDDQYQCCGDIYHTQLESGTYSAVQKSEVLSSEADEESLFLSPNEDYIIIQSWRSEFASKHDLYVSYRTKDGSWTPPDRLDTLINSKEIEQRPFVSPDNQFLFFSRTSVTQKNGQEVYDSDIYWVSTKSVFRPYAYNTQMEASVKYNEIFQLTIPQDVFKDVDQEQLSFKLSLEDGSEIPQWISLDAEKLRLSGKWNTKGAIHLKLTATDVYENSAEFSFELSEKSH